jgi:hypothetical protein
MATRTPTKTSSPAAPAKRAPAARAPSARKTLKAVPT